MKILVTGAAGFIGFSLSKLLLSKKHKIVGIDNINDYYSKKLKRDRQTTKTLCKNKGKDYLYSVSKV